MPKKATILLDLSHKEMLDLQESEFLDFCDLIKSLGFKVKVNQNKNFSNRILNSVDILVIGNPVGEYFSTIEIRSIIDFVRKGGSLLVVSEYGGDYLQKTNLNDITGKHFGIFFQKNLVKENNSNNNNCSSILNVQSFQEHKITHQLRNVSIAGSCSLLLDKIAEPLLYINNSWTEVYNESSQTWSKEEEGKRQILASCTEYGKGRVVSLGDIDIFTNDMNIGLNCLDNHRFIANILEWLSETANDTDALSWILNQVGILQNEIKEISGKINNIIETMTILEKRISKIEDFSDEL